jgi:hypothetical protein
MKKWLTSENVTTFVLMAVAAAVGIVIVAPWIAKAYSKVTARAVAP